MAFSIRLILGALVTPVLLFPCTSYAETPSATSSVPDQMPMANVANSGSSGLQSCFDFYRFGSVPVVLTPGETSASQGTQLRFSGKITNENAYPIINAGIYAKVLRERNNGIKSSFGPDVTDWIVVEKGITLQAGESKDVSFTWSVPRDAEPGNYSLATYVASNDRFNLYGLTFTNDVVGGLVRFKVEGEDTGSARFDIENLIVGTTILHSAAFSPRMDVPDGKVPVVASIGNTKNTAVSGTVDWKLFWWDGLRTDRLLDESKQHIDIPAHASSTVSYTVTDNNHSVYYLMGTLTPDNGGALSIIAPRYVSGSVAEPRFNFVGVTSYPVGPGSALFACVHSTGQFAAKDVRVVVTARKNSLLAHLLGRDILSTKEYDGDVPGANSAISAPITASSTSFTLNAKVYQAGKLVDNVTIPYSCKDLGAQCDHKDSYILAAIITVLVLILIGLGYVIWRRVRARRSVSYHNQTHI